MRGPKRAGGERSNAWSGSRSTNQTPFNPFDSEVPLWGFKGRPSFELPVGGRAALPIFCRPLHSAFLRPFEPSDVAEVLTAVPPEFLLDLEGVHLLSGSSKQAHATGLFHFGCYGLGRIYLHAFPKTELRRRLTRPPKPSVRQEYLRAGVKFTNERGACFIEFSEASIRKFYLYDVLLHELGHHVERARNHDRRSSERYADWFAEEQARRLAEANDSAAS